MGETTIGGLESDIRSGWEAMLCGPKPAISAKSVKVEVDGFDCADEHQLRCENACSRVLKEVVEDLFV